MRNQNACLRLVKVKLRSNSGSKSMIGGVVGRRVSVSMERIESSAVRLRKKLLSETFRCYCPVFLAGIALGGSLLKELSPLPDTYWNNKKNLFNVYFVKLSWGWTLWFLLPFIVLTNYTSTRSKRVVIRRVSSMLVSTVIWNVCTHSFMYVEITGSCYTSETLLKIEHGNKMDCKHNGGYWHGFDISGHSFLLPYCILLILEETSIINYIKPESQFQKTAINALCLVLGGLSVIWTCFFCTAIYFHNFMQNIGTVFGILAWYVTYKWWYLMPLSPGLPTGSTSRSPTKRTKIFNINYILVI
ncbi:LOW QUALITY PROTEIN: acyl-coenzyme A diphosphatase FITM2 [Rhinophrynus dorsalis]